MIWPSLVINLDANAARLSASAGQLDALGLPWARLPAVNGRALPDTEIAAVYDAAANRRFAKAPLVASEIGCYLSHIEAWRRIAGGDAPGGFVFEDDFLADDTLADDMACLSENPNWDMVKLFSFDPDPKLIGKTALRDGKEIGRPYRVPTCMIAYGLTRDAAQRLLARVPPFFRPVDEDQKFVWETGLDVALVLPPPVVVGDQQTVTGTIGDARRDARERGVGSVLRRIRYRADYLARLTLHRMRSS